VLRASHEVRVEDLMRHALAELRLVFHVAKNPRRLHEPYLVHHRELLDVLEARDAQTAEDVLTAYLADAQRQLLRAYTHATQQ
jgi:DNA-binding GntR family transcriptional regulator